MALKVRLAMTMTASVSVLDYKVYNLHRNHNSSHCTEHQPRTTAMSPRPVWREMSSQQAAAQPVITPRPRPSSEPRLVLNYKYKCRSMTLTAVTLIITCSMFNCLQN